MKSKKLYFSNREGHQLAGQLDQVDSECRSYALFAHCFTCSRSLKAAHEMSSVLIKKGLGVLRFDFTGLGESHGEFGETNFSSNVSDLVDAAHYMAGEGWAPELLVGHSLGGTAVLRAASEINSVRAVVTLAAPAHPSHLLRHFEKASEEIHRKGEAIVELEGRPFRIKQQFLEDLAESRLQGSIRELNRALLVLHSPADDVVKIENASEIFQRARHPKSFVCLENADHLLSRPEDARYAGNLIAAWSDRYLRATPSRSE